MVDQVLVATGRRPNTKGLGLRLTLGGARTVKASDYFHGFYTVNLQPSEIGKIAQSLAVKKERTPLQEELGHEEGVVHVARLEHEAPEAPAMLRKREDGEADDVDVAPGARGGVDGEGDGLDVHHRLPVAVGAAVEVDARAHGEHAHRVHQVRADPHAGRQRDRDDRVGHHHDEQAAGVDGQTRAVGVAPGRAIAGRPDGDLTTKG